MVFEKSSAHHNYPYDLVLFVALDKVYLLCKKMTTVLWKKITYHTGTVSAHSAFHSTEEQLSVKTQPRQTQLTHFNAFKPGEMRILSAVNTRFFIDLSACGDVTQHRRVSRISDLADFRNML